MDEWVQKALAKWPNVPSLFGWLSLDRRGRWSIKGQSIDRPSLIEIIGRNYASDEYGRWFFQNGPQRGFVDLEYAPLVLRVEGNKESLATHSGQRVERLSAAYLDEEGALLLVCEHGPGLLADLDWALTRLQQKGRPMTETDLEEALAKPSGESTGLTLACGSGALAVARLDAAAAPDALGFVRRPQPLGNEVSCEQADQSPSP